MTRVKVILLIASVSSRFYPLSTEPFFTLTPGLKRKRGNLGCKLRGRPFKPPLPSTILSNVRSFKNKMDLLHAKCLTDASFREACVLSPGVYSRKQG